jgi:hypothetical protein
LKCAGLKAQVEKIRNVYKTLARNLEGRDLLKDLGVDGMVIKKLNLKEYSQRTGFV